MMWSQLKKRTEENFAVSLQGRLEVFNTRYRDSHDQEGEGWISLDKKKIYNFASTTYLVESGKKAQEIRQATGNIDFRNPEHREGYYAAYREADLDVEGRGIFALWDFNQALFELLNISIDEAVKSKNPIVRAFAVVDKRFGKRRILDYDDSNEHQLVKLMLSIRKEAEGIAGK